MSAQVREERGREGGDGEEAGEPRRVRAGTSEAQKQSRETKKDPEKQNMKNAQRNDNAVVERCCFYDGECPKLHVIT